MYIKRKYAGRDCRVLRLKILYHSGAGSTKAIAEIFNYKLSSLFVCDIEQIDLEYEYSNLLLYDFLIFGFPTYHCEASRSMAEFLNQMPELSESKRAFVFTTCGLFSGNTLREFINACNDKNIVVCGYNTYKAPATDGALLLPPIKFMFEYGKNVPRKILNDLNSINNILKGNERYSKCPRFKLYTILNFPNKYFGKRYKHKFKIIENRCVRCDTCVKECMRKCWKRADGGLTFDMHSCESCLKCIHHCPSSAIVLTKNTAKKKKMNSSFYEQQKNKIFQEIE
ncbi:4Fe-4S ferredoxin iron-sulfur binding domain-containing protein [Chitinispirillum alkaliphilum]|nr:4Fe-4S ferredoxin iron-sulfur binding domain-containing protein [Chitinispirillum alkaliphilum]